MSDSWEDLCVEVFGDDIPRLPIDRRRRGQDFAEVARLNLRKDTVVPDILVVIDDCFAWVQSTARSQADYC